MAERVITTDSVFRCARKAYFQITVGSGETVQMLGKAQSAADFAPINEDFTASTWIFVEDLQFIDMKFIIPAGSQVVQVSAV